MNWYCMAEIYSTHLPPQFFDHLHAQGSGFDVTMRQDWIYDVRDSSGHDGGVLQAMIQEDGSFAVMVLLIRSR